MRSHARAMVEEVPFHGSSSSSQSNESLGGPRGPARTPRGGAVSSTPVRLPLYPFAGCQFVRTLADFLPAGRFASWSATNNVLRSLRDAQNRDGLHAELRTVCSDRSTLLLALFIRWWCRCDAVYISILPGPNTWAFNIFWDNRK